jgi:hypothetical protein
LSRKSTQAYILNEQKLIIAELGVLGISSYTELASSADYDIVRKDKYWDCYFSNLEEAEII